MVTALNSALATGVASSASYNAQLFQMGRNLRSLPVPIHNLSSSMGLLNGQLSAGGAAIGGITEAEAKWNALMFRTQALLRGVGSEVLDFFNPAMEQAVDWITQAHEATDGWSTGLGIAAFALGSVATASGRARTAILATNRVLASGARQSFNRPASTVAQPGRGAPSRAAQQATRVPGFPTPSRTASGGGGFTAGAGRALGAAGFALPFITEAFQELSLIHI